MNSPFAALTWEIWCRHRKRLLTVGFIILGFALFYPTLCASIGLNLESPNVLDSIAEKASQIHGNRMEILQLLAWMIFGCAPLACMVITMFYVVWIFTFTDLNPREPFSFPKRFFTLPISTGFLASRLIVSSTVGVLLVYLGWTRLVHLPHLYVFDEFNDSLTWITLLIVSQAIVWSLDAFPFTRMLMLMVVVSLLLARPDFDWYRTLEAHQMPIRLATILVGCIMSFVGLDKIRHGRWQGWFWKWPTSSASERKELRGPKSFRSASHAQFWFEWRRQGRKIFYTVCVLAVVPVLVMIPELLLHPGAESADPTFGLCMYLFWIPPFMHFCHGVSYERVMSPFTANRPLDNGEIIVAQWKVMALSAVLSWLVIFALMGIVLLAGDRSVMNVTLDMVAKYHPLIRPLMPLAVPGMVICTWAVGVDRVWVGATWGTWIYRIYEAVIILMGGFGFTCIFAATHPNNSFQGAFFQVLPPLLGFLVGLKFLLAQWAFRAALKKQLIARLTVVRYSLIWAALAVAFLAPVIIVCGRASGAVTLCLNIILLLPLARIGFAPLGLDLGRHR